MSIDPFSLFLTLALTGAQMALSASRKIEGPRTDTKVSIGDYGAPLPLVWGKRRQQVPVIWGEELTEVKEETKTKGGKYNDYKYYGTWDVALAGVPIDGVTRMWFDTHLVYDVTSAGPVAPVSLIGAFVAGKGGGGTSEFRGITRFMTIFLGTDDQEPTERMKATVEAEHGVGSCPGYRGTPHITFENLPLAKWGNRIPQVSVEMVRIKAGSYPKETFPTVFDPPNRLWNIAFSPDYSRIMWMSPFDSASFEIWDVAARSLMISGTLATGGTLAHGPAIKDDGSFYVVGPAFGDSRLYLYEPDGLGYAEVMDFGGFGQMQLDVFVARDADGVEHWGTTPYFNTTSFFDGAAYDPVDDALVPLVVACWFADSYGDVWAAASNGSGPDEVYFLRRVNASGRGGSDRVKVTVAAGHGASMAIHYRDADVDQFIFYSGSTIYAADIETGAVNFSVSASLDVYDTAKQFRWCPPGASSLYLGGTELSLADLTTIRTLNLGTGPWGTVEVDSSIYDPVNHALWTFPQFTNQTTILYLDRITGGVTTLASVVDEVCAMSGIAADEIDTSALTQTITGYSAVISPGKDMLEPLLDLYDIDARPHGFKLEFLPRGGVAGAALSSEDFVQPAEGEPVYDPTIPGSTDLASQVLLQFADVDAEQQPNSAQSGPLFETDGERVQPIDMSTLVLDVDDARQLVARYHRRQHFDANTVALSLPSRQLALEPGDVRPLLLDGETVRARADSMVLGADRRIETLWKRDDASVASLDGATGADFDGRSDAVVSVAGISRCFALDIPLLRDADTDATPQLYLGASPYTASAWPGATIYEAISGEYSAETRAVATGEAATWGHTTGVLADADPAIWDRGNSVNVRLQRGTLSGTTEAAIHASPTLNQILIGGEILNFASATLEGDGSYTLSDLRRGRRGTEWACGSHTASDLVVLLAGVRGVDQGLSEVGTDLSFKAVTSGRVVSSAFPANVIPFTGASLKPYAPCHLEASLDSGSGDWTLAWVRRTRVGGAWTSGTTTPLSELTEEYEVDIYDGLDVVRTITVTAATATYSAADQTTDFGAPQTSLSWSVQQISDAVGRGFLALAA